MRELRPTLRSNYLTGLRNAGFAHHRIRSEIRAPKSTFEPDRNWPSAIPIASVLAPAIGIVSGTEQQLLEEAIKQFGLQLRLMLAAWLSRAYFRSDRDAAAAYRRDASVASLVSVAKHISPFKIWVIARFSSAFFLATYMCTVSHTSYEAC
jgi:hypothetical protein